MKNLILAAAIVAAAALPSIASAQSAMAAPAAAVACHAAQTGETSNATMGGTALVCKSVNVARLKADMGKLHSMMVAHNMSPADMTAMSAPIRNIIGEFNLPKTPGGADSFGDR